MHALFSFHGRLARLSYFGYSLLVIVLVVVLIGIAVGGLSYSDLSMNSGVWIASGVLFAIGVVFYIWCGLALDAKRLHDLGLSGWHNVWIWGIILAGSAANEVNDPFLDSEGYIANALVRVGAGNAAPALAVVSMVLSLVSLGVWLWLLFAPSQPSDNAYGPVAVSRK